MFGPSGPSSCSVCIRITKKSFSSTLTCTVHVEFSIHTQNFSTKVRTIQNCNIYRTNNGHITPTSYKM